MKFNKDSKLMKISASASGYYSNATAYGEILVPYEIYVKNEDILVNDFYVYVGELDGKHSETECDINFEECSIKDILKTKYEPHEDDRDIDESVFYRLCDVLDLSETQGNELGDFNIALWELEKFYDYETVAIKLEKDTEIQGIIVPKDTRIEFRQENGKTIPADWEFEFELNI